MNGRAIFATCLGLVVISSFVSNTYGEMRADKEVDIFLGQINRLDACTDINLEPFSTRAIRKLYELSKNDLDKISNFRPYFYKELSSRRAI